MRLSSPPAAVLLLAACCTLACGARVVCGEPKPIETGVVVRSGKLLAGRVTGSARVGDHDMWIVETDFGELFVPKRATKRVVHASRHRGMTTGDQTFQIKQIRVIKIKGVVERRSPGAMMWHPLTLEDRYTGERPNTANALIRPGDTVRTKAGALLEFMPHKDVWVRLAANSEIEIPLAAGPASVHLARGRTIQDVRGSPRGQVFRVRTPLTVLGMRDGTASIHVAERESVTVRRGSVLVGEGPRVGVGKTATWGRDQTAPQVAPQSTERSGAFPPTVTEFPVDEMIYVPRGMYRLSTEGKIGTEDSWTTVDVFLEGFLIDRREVANEEYAAFAAATGTSVPGYFVDGKPPAGREREPVYDVTWVAAQAFARWTGKALPLEAQWAAAAHGPKDAHFPWGNDISSKYRELERGSFTASTWTPPARFPSVDANTLDESWIGVLALGSGVPEWCEDFFSHYLYAGGVPYGPLEAKTYTVRGWHTSDYRDASTRAPRRYGKPSRGKRTGPGLRLVIDTVPRTRAAAGRAKRIELRPLKGRAAARAKSSVSHTRATSIHFVNCSDRSVDLFWVDWAGNRVPYGSLGAGRSLNQASWVDDVWVVVDQGRDAGVYMAAARPGRAKLDLPLAK